MDEPTTPPIDTIPVASPPKNKIKLSVILPVLAMVLALPILVLSTRSRKLTNSNAANPATYCGSLECITPATYCSGSNCLTPTPVAQTCPVANNYVDRTHYYGYVYVNNVPAALGATIQAYSPRNELVGCGAVSLAQGGYPLMNVYGKVGSIGGNQPGMLDGEQVLFKINNNYVTSSPGPIIWHGGLGSTRVDLYQSTPIISTPSAPVPSPTPTLQPSPTPMPTIVVYPIPSPTPTVIRPTTIITTVIENPTIIPIPSRNSLPQITSSPTVISWQVGKLIKFTITGTDANLTDTMTMSATGLPNGLTLNSCTATKTSTTNNLTCTVSGTPTKNGVFTTTVALLDSQRGVAKKVIYFYIYPSFFVNVRI